MANYIYYGEAVSSDDLEHYGVIGMKWGVRKGHVNEAYAEGIRKKRQIDAETKSHKLAAAKYSEKAAKYEVKSYKKRNSEKSEKLEGKSKQFKFKAAKETRKAERLAHKGDKWMKTMNETFADYDIKVIKNGNIKSERGKAFIDKYGPDIYELSLRKEIEHSDFLEHYGVPGMKWGKRKYAQYRDWSANRASRKVDRLIEKDRRERVKEQHNRSLYEQRATTQRLEAAAVNAEKGRRASADALAKARSIAIIDAKAMSNEKRVRAQKAMASYQKYVNKVNIENAKRQIVKNTKNTEKMKRQNDKTALYESKLKELEAKKAYDNSKKTKSEPITKESTNDPTKIQNGSSQEHARAESSVRGKPPKANSLTDRDLNSYINRLQNEDRYNQMAHPVKYAIKEASKQAFTDVSKRAAGTLANHLYGVGLKHVNNVLKEAKLETIEDKKPNDGGVKKFKKK